MASGLSTVLLFLCLAHNFVMRENENESASFYTISFYKLRLGQACESARTIRETHGLVSLTDTRSSRGFAAFQQRKGGGKLGHIVVCADINVSQFALARNIC